jgi:2-polyprenyl-3-methyl-5-hydroxy-6-metoxy-1,4-benzoquinol methylase
MNFSFENYWKTIYEKRTNENYQTQSIQSIEIINWHKNYIEENLARQFKDYNPRVLDIGCCSGYLTNLFCKFSDKVVGIDYQEGFILEAQKKYPNPKFYTGDIYNLKKINGRFDLIVCFAVLQHISDLELALKNIKLKLSEIVNSKVLFTTINYKSVFNRTHFSHKLAHPKEKEDFKLNVYSREELDKFSQLAGLKITQYKYNYIFPKSLGFLGSLLKHFLPSSFSHHIFVEMQHI